MADALLRRTEASDQGTFGLFTLDGLTLFSGELPDRDNAPGVSCIPPGEYRCERRFSPRFKRETYWLRDVPSRSFILIHSANLMGDAALGFKSQLNGCIALGQRRGTMGGQKAILVSAPAITDLETATNREPFTLEVRNEFA
jgi:hypothetical protein